MNLNLKNKNAFVAGSSKGIGKATAIELASLGANITLAARNESKLKQVLEELDTSQGQQHQFLIIDFEDQQGLQQKVNALVEKKPFHILINNTGGPKGGPIHKANPTEFLQAYNNHIICNHLLLQAMLEGMKAEGFGRVINIISTSVKTPIPNLGVSNTTRGAVASWAKTMSIELAGFGITVNNVLPGFTNTGRLNEIIDARANKQGVSQEQVIKQMVATVPANRFGEPSEIAAAAAFLATPAAAYINGTNVVVDGGRTKCL